MRKPKIFHGYWIVLVGFLCLFVDSGFSFYSFSLFVNPLQISYGWGRGDIMLGLTIYIGIMGLTSPFVGKLIDRYGPMKVISVGAFIAGLGFILLSQTQSLWHFYAGYIIVAIGMGGASQIAASAVISNWFRKRRGTAIGIASTGVGVGGLVMAPVIGSFLIPTFDWRVTYFVLAVSVWVIIIPLTLLWVRTKPTDMGLYPDGIANTEIVAEDKPPVTISAGIGLRAALATPAFWLIAVAFFTSQLGVDGVVQNQVPYLEDIGFPLAVAATALGAVGFGSAIGKFVFGWLCDYIPAKYSCAIGLALQATGIIMLMNIGAGSPTVLIWLYAIVMGLGLGSWLPTMSMLASTNFGLTSYGAIFGMLSLVQRVGASVGPITAGYMYDAMGTYHLAFIILVSFYAIAIPATMIIRRPRQMV